MSGRTTDQAADISGYTRPLDPETAGLMDQLIDALDQLYRIRCACCGQEGRHHARGWITACYWRWFRAGKPADGPPPLPPGYRPRPALHKGPASDRIEDYGWLRREQGLTREQAAERLGVCERTAWRYERALRLADDYAASGEVA